MSVNRDEPSLGKYVRMLELDLNNSPAFQGVFKEPMRVEPPGPFAGRSRALLSPWRGQKARDIEHPARQVTSFIASLDQLTSFTVKWYWCSPTHPSYDLYTNIFLPGWSTFSRRLRCLSLHLTAESFSYLFFRDLQFTQLDTLSLQLFIHSNTTTAQSSPEPFLHFIHRHYKTLKSLRIISLHPIDERSFYLGIGRLPKLEVLKLEDPSPSALAAIGDFLLHNSATLTEFCWANKLSPGWATTSTHPTCTGTPLDIHLPKLKKLSLDFAIFRKRSYDLGHILGYISRHAETLSSLALTGQHLTQAEFCALLDTVITLRIHTLEVSLRNITSSTFPTVATYLPNLDTLAIEYSTVDPDVYNVTDSPDVYPASLAFSDQFVRDMQASSLKIWHLGTLFVKRRGFWHRPGGVVPTDHPVVRTILDNIPRVEYINGIYREEFLKLEVKGEERE